MDATLRAQIGADRDFLRRLFGEIRGRELGLARADEAMLRALLDMQFAAQQQSYRQNHPGARCDIIEASASPIGRQVVARSDHALLLLDIALLPAWCGQGMGSKLVRALQREAAGAGLPLRLHVALNNPAEALYRRLGFKETGVSGMHRAMEWENDND
jgi:ribosomal protein S18 acetylase RimI-like enzyme